MYLYTEGPQCKDENLYPGKTVTSALEASDQKNIFFAVSILSVNALV
jgi:hypothetical protein